jgi:hypothetical protein
MRRLSALDRYAEYEPARHAYRAVDAPRMQFGFRVKVLWVMAPGASERVTISGSKSRQLDAALD